MNTSDPQFDDPVARQTWSDYFRAVDRHLRPVAAGRRAEIREELVAHVLDGLDAEPDGDVASGLKNVLTRLGPPATYLDRVVGESDLAEPRSTAWRIRHGASSLGRTFLLGASYLFGFMALMLALAKPFYPDNVGVFRMSSGWWVAGFVDSAGARDLLGFWVIPLMLAIVFLLWVVVPRRLINGGV